MADTFRALRIAEAMREEEAEAVEEDTDSIAAEVVVADPTARTPTSKASGMASGPRNRRRLVLSIRLRRLRRLRSPLNQHLYISISNLSSSRTVYRRGLPTLPARHHLSRLFLPHSLISILSSRVITYSNLARTSRRVIDMTGPRKRNRKWLCPHLGRISILRFWKRCASISSKVPVSERELAGEFPFPQVEPIGLADDFLRPGRPASLRKSNYSALSSNTN
jgi:hypothetical protein